MNYISHILHLTLMVLILYLTTIRECDGRKRHTQHSRRPTQDWYEYSLPSYNDYSSKLREQKLLMEINVSISGIIQALQQKQQQPVFLPFYVPYFMQNNGGYNLLHNVKGEIIPPSKQVFRPSVSKPSKEVISPTIPKPSKEALKPMVLKPSEEAILPPVSKPNQETINPTVSKPSKETIRPTISKPNEGAFRPTVPNPAGAEPTEATVKKDTKPEKINININNRLNSDDEAIKDTKDNGIESPQVPNSRESLKCETATVACCRFSKPEERKNCFEFYKCFESYDNTHRCSNDSISRAINSFVTSYAPSKRHTLGTHS